MQCGVVIKIRDKNKRKTNSRVISTGSAQTHIFHSATLVFDFCPSSSDCMQIESLGRHQFPNNCLRFTSKKLTWWVAVINLGVALIFCAPSAGMCAYMLRVSHFHDLIAFKVKIAGRSLLPEVLLKMKRRRSRKQIQSRLKNVFLRFAGVFAGSQTVKSVLFSHLWKLILVRANIIGVH